jgi:dihydrofolate reductase
VKLSIVVAISENGVIGDGQRLPWRLRDEQQAVMQLTLGHCLLMGRKTWESIGRPLRGRTSIVISRDPSFATEHEEVEVVSSLAAAVESARARGDDEAFVFGGAAIYALALPIADRLYLTRVHTQSQGETLFPEFDPTGWTRTDAERHEADDRNEHAFTMERWQRA